MNTYKLPLYENNLLTGSNQSTHILSMALIDDRAFEWFAENYIQMVIYYDNYSFVPMFYNFMDTRVLYSTDYHLVANNNICPFLDIYRYRYEEWSNQNQSIIESIKQRLEQNFYVSLYVDTSCIPQYTTKGYIHNPLIYGFNDEENVFYMMDFWDLHYESKKISYDCFEKALNSFIDSDDENPAFYRYGINCFRRIEFEYKIDMERLKLQLGDYLAGDEVKSSYERFLHNKKCRYGISILDNFIEYVMGKNEFDEIDLGYSFLCISVIIDHKLAMLTRLEWLFKNGYIVKKDYDSIYDGFMHSYNTAKKIRNLAIKYSIKKNRKIMESMIEKLRLLKEFDITYINLLIEVL